MSNDDHDDPYQAIPCSDYSHYELWIMRGRRLQLAWWDEHGQEYIGLLQPLDLLTRDRQEFLIGRLAGQNIPLQIRLDRIIRCKPE